MKEQRAKWRSVSGEWFLWSLTGLLSLTAAAHVTPDPLDLFCSNWASHNGRLDESAYSALKDINPASIARLGLAWSLDLPGEQSLEATPLAVNGVLYFTGSLSAVYAVDAPTGHVLWRYDPRVWEHMPAHLRYVFGANRGVAYAQGRVFVGTLDGRLIALDAPTGRPLWVANTVTEASKHTITGAPRVAGSMVLIGNGGADWGERGYVTAYDMVTGAQRWRFYTVPGNPAEDGQNPALERAAQTWAAGHWKLNGGGGTVWDSITYDAELHRVYLGVGNAGPYNPRVRDPGGGDNLFVASIVALEASSGRYLWHYQENPREAWDYKATTNMILATLPIHGTLRKVLMQAPTNGFFYVLDRMNGRLISAAKLGKVTWADDIDLASGRPIERADIRYETGSTVIWPSPLGLHNWQPMSYDPDMHWVYIPAIQLGAKWTVSSPTATPRLELLRQDPEDGHGFLLAWDPVAQALKWRVQHASLWNGGLLSTGGLVFQGTGDGHFIAYDAGTGIKLWQFDTGLGIVGAPVTYRAGRRQYLSILVGYGGGTALGSEVMNQGWKFGAQPRRLLTFALDAHEPLPTTAPADFTVKAVDDPTFVLQPALISEGAQLYGPCALCHGANLQSSGLAPDLRESRAALNSDSFRAVVYNGVLIAQGMPRFNELTDQQLLALYTYIRAAARASLHRVPPPQQLAPVSRP